MAFAKKILLSPTFFAMILLIALFYLYKKCDHCYNYSAVKPSPRKVVPSYNEAYQRKLNLFGKRVSYINVWAWKCQIKINNRPFYSCVLSCLAFE